VLSLEPTLTVQNLGSNEITSLTFTVSDSNGILSEQDWSGNIAPSGFGFIPLDNTISISESTSLTYEVTNVNGEPDGHSYFNNTTIELSNVSTQSPTIMVEIQADAFAAGEINWFFINSDGDTLFREVNVGGGELIIEEFELTAGVDDCYEILLTDNFGDGLITYDGSSTHIRVTDENSNELIFRDMSTFFFSSFSLLVDANLNSSSTNDLNTVSGLKVFPNPVDQSLNINFGTNELVPLQIGIFNTLGQQVKIVANGEFGIGNQQIKTNVGDLSNGVYYIRLMNEKGQKIQKFNVLH